jgi:hypothetical protein
VSAFTFDTSDLRDLAADLRQAPAKVQRGVGAVIFKGALNIKTQLVDEMSASRHFKGAASSIDFDMSHRGAFSAIEAEIGPRSGPGEPGALANIAYFGTSRGGGTVPDPQRALDAEAPRVEKALADLLEDSL